METRNTVMSTGRRNKGRKIVENSYSKNVSDIFNTGNTPIKPRSSSVTYDDKMRLVENHQKYIESKIRVNKI